jgi:hypothetical protein
MPYRTLVVGVFVCAVVGSGLVSAAGATTVDLSPGDRLVETGETTTVAIEVAAADDGVGSFDLAVRVANGTVADVESVAVSGSPGLVDREYDADDDEVRVVASGMDTGDSGPVDVATVTLEKVADGTTDVTLSVSALGDESGDDYDVTDTEGATIHQHVPSATPTTTQPPTDTPTDSVTVATTETTVTSEPVSTVGVSSNVDTSTTTVVNTTTPVETSGFAMWPGVLAGLAVVLAVGAYVALREDDAGYDNLLE